MKKNILILVFNSILVLSFSQSDIKSYIYYKKTIETIDSSIETGNFDLAKKLIIKTNKNKIPKDHLNNYYTDCLELYLNLDKFDIATDYAKKAIQGGCKENYLNYLKRKYDTTLFTHYIKFKQFEKRYIQLLNEYREKLDQKLITVANTMYNNDQSIRHIIMQSLKNQVKLDSLILVLEKFDSINQNTYDSLIEKYGWLYRELLGYELRNYNIILAHGTSLKRLKYVDIGYKLAVKNKVSWLELIDIESFDFIKTENKVGNISFLINFIINNKKDIDKDFNEFIAYCIKYDLNDGGTFNGKEKRIRLYINCYDNLISIKSANEILYLLKEKIISFGLNPEKLKLISVEQFNRKKQ